MLTLALLRHAKSNWDVPGALDFERDLAPRGLEAAPRMGREIARLGFSPDLVLCSDAVRARMTFELVAPSITPPPRTVLYEKRLYMASARELLARLHEVPDTVKSVMLVGHNPGFHELNIALIGDAAPGAERAAKSKFPTCALAIYTFDTDQWAQVAPRKGRVIHFATPRGLSGG
ncbi:MAG: histidine phosphatase family protein [Hyphomicrobium sp.]|nr:histidine phosphatase family protein [Hyphomicrobium sp.]